MKKFILLLLFITFMSCSGDKNKKISFFHLGPKNDWRKILNTEIKVKLEKTFEKELKELTYI